MKSEVWNRQEAAEYLKATPGYITYLVQTNQIPHFHMSPRRVRFDSDEIKAWVKKKHREKKI